jgi:hypothetical protein
MTRDAAHVFAMPMMELMQLVDSSTHGFGVMQLASLRSNYLLTAEANGWGLKGLCLFKFAFALMLLTSINIEIPTPQWNCPYCLRGFASRDSFQRHLEPDKVCAQSYYSFYRN